MVELFTLHLIMLDNGTESDIMEIQERREKMMLEQNDLIAIRKIMKEEITESEKRTDARFEESEKRIDARFAESEKRMDARFEESENLILEELERTRSILEKEIAQVQKNLDEISQYYRITKLENDNTALLLKMIDELSRRIENLEKKTA